MVRSSLLGLVFASLVLPQAAQAEDPPYKQWLGKQRALVLLVEWRNKEANVDVREVEDTFFGEGTKSLREFFTEGSAGKFDLSGDVRPWKRSSKHWFGFLGCNAKRLSDEAWRLHGPEVDISDYDADNDGKIDHLFVVHSGRISKDRVGPDCVFRWSGTDYANHVAVFQSQGLGSKGNKVPIGFYLHEAGHGYFALGDYYGKHKHGKYGSGMWGMMALGCWGPHNQIPVDDLFRYPVHFEPASKLRIGWADPLVVTADRQRVRLRPVELTNDVAVIPVDKYNSYYLEYRTPRGFSKELPGHGLLLWQNWWIQQADGRDDLNRGRDLGRRPLPPITENFGDSGDPFPGETRRTFFVDAKAGIIVERIQTTEEFAEFDVRFLGRDKSRPSTPAPGLFLNPFGYEEEL